MFLELNETQLKLFSERYIVGTKVVDEKVIKKFERMNIELLSEISGM